MFDKVLIHDDDSTEVHLVKDSFMADDETLCDERVHSINSVHIVNDEIPVTCIKCLVKATDIAIAMKEEITA